MRFDEETKKGWKGTVRAMLTKHPDKFSKDADSDDKGGKMNPWAIAHSMAKKGAKSHYKDQESSLEGKPEKKEKYKDEDEDKNEGFMTFKEFVQAQQAAPVEPPQAMTASITTKVDQLLNMIGVKSPIQIQQIRDELNRRLQTLQADKGWGQRAANLSYRNAAQARREV